MLSLCLPVVVWAVLVSHNDDGYFGIVFDRVYAICGVRVVLSGVRRQALQRRLPTIDRQLSFFLLVVSVWETQVYGEAYTRSA